MIKTKWRTIALIVLMLVLTVGVTILMAHCDPAGRNRVPGSTVSEEGEDGVALIGADDPTPEPTPTGAPGETAGAAVATSSAAPGAQGTPEPKGNMLYWTNRNWTISDDASEAGLKRSPAFQPGAADPTAGRLCVILGDETDGQFSCLANALPGDVVELWFDGDLLAYEVVDSIAFDDKDAPVYPETTDRILIIVVYYTEKSAPAGKLAVYCKPMED